MSEEKQEKAEKTEKTELVFITDKALEQMRRIVEESEESLDGVRLGVIGGGCSGLSYKLELSQKREKDYTLKGKGVQILVDPKSAIYLKGIVLDYKDGLNGKGFVFDNPNAKNTCGCGESFSI